MKNLLKDIYLFLFIFCIFFVGRLVLLFSFGGAEESPNFDWYSYSARFDLMSASYFLIPCFALTLVSLLTKWIFPKIRFAYTVFAIFASFLIASINVGYFSVYSSQYNYFVFGIFYDEVDKIMAFIFSEFPVFLNLALIVISFAFIWIFTKISFRKIDRLNFNLNFLKRAILAMAYIAVFVGLARGGKYTGRPLQLRDTAVSNSAFLNGLVPSSAFCLKSEISKFVANYFSDGLSSLNAEEADIPNYSKELLGQSDIDSALTHKASGQILKRPPSHIFVIMGESYSSWPLIRNFPNFQVMPELKSILEDERAPKISTLKCIPSGGGTMASISSLIAGLPFTGLTVDGVFRGTDVFAPAKIMMRLGYDTTFFYGGQSTWLQLGEFAKFNRFEKVVGGESMGELYNSTEWGMRDKDMFNFILKYPFPEKSFSMILTVSNHEPYDINLAEEGCPAKISTDNERKVWHHWYGDVQLWKFVRKMQERYPDALFVITGDHKSRTFPEAVSSVPDDTCVPLIFYGNCLEETVSPDCAQTLDIVPTLVEMLAPKDFEYLAWGHNLRSKSKRMFPAINPIAACLDGKIYLMDARDTPSELREISRKLSALSYYRQQGENEK